MVLDSPNRILHIVGAMNRAGTETMLMNIYRNIDKTKVQFDFISYCRDEAHYDKEIQSLGGKVIRIANTQSIKQLVQVIKMNGPYQAVHSHTLFHCGIANMAAKLAGIKVRIAHAHTTVDQSDNLLRKMYISTMRKLITNTSTHLLACSNEAGRYLFGDRNLQKGNYRYFPNLIDYKQFLQPDLAKVRKFRKEAGLEDSLVIGHIGRFIEAKNHKFLLEIIKVLCKRQANSKLLLVGDGDLREEIEEKARKEGIYEYIRFVGLQSDISTMLHSMDVFVFPSIYEGLGLVLLEAQASGIPCLVSEAIQPEADLKLGLVSRLYLEDGAETWVNKILEIVESEKVDIQKITDGFQQNGYEIPVGISNLMDIYQI